MVGPSLPPGFQPALQQSSDDESDPGIGPMPHAADPQEVEKATARDFEMRAKKMKDKLLNKVSILIKLKDKSVICVL